MSDFYQIPFDDVGEGADLVAALSRQLASPRVDLRDIEPVEVGTIQLEPEYGYWVAVSVGDSSGPPEGSMRSRSSSPRRTGARSTMATHTSCPTPAPCSAWGCH